jgi:UDP-glucose 4-epimerase
MADLEAAYHGLRVLVLGGTGFIGWNLVDRLCRSGAEVTVFARNNSQSWEVLPENPHPRFVAGDLANLAAIEAAVRDQEIVFNAAGRSGALSSNQHPLADLEANCRGTLHVLEACRRLNPGARIVFPGSRLQFGQPRYLPVDEMHPMQPLCIYGVHKLAGENYHVLYHRLYGLKTTVLRISNLYGPSPINHQMRYNIVNHFTRQALRGGPLRVFGDGQQLRDYLYIGDLVDAFLLAGIQPEAVGQVFNVGSGQPIPFLEMARTIVEVMGDGWIEAVPWPADYEAVETGDFYFDSSHIRKTLGWEPTTDLVRGIQRTAERLSQMLGAECG